MNPAWPATITQLAPGCSGSAGPNTIQYNNCPFIGSTLTGFGVGFPTGGLAVQIRGLTSLPQPFLISSVLAGGQPGCFLLPSPDVLDTLTSPFFGIAIPNNPLLIGQSIFHQLAFFEPSGNITSTNGFQLTFGDF